MLAGPLFGRFIDRHGPWLSLLVATCCLLVLQGVETAAAGINIAALIVFCVGLNAFRQSQTVSLQTIVFGKVSLDHRMILSNLYPNQDLGERPITFERCPDAFGMHVIFTGSV